MINAIDTDLEWVHAHTRLLTRAIEWESKGRNNSFVLRGVDLRSAEQWLAQAGTNKERQPTALQTEYIIASRKTAVRRQPVLLTGVTVALILTIGLAILAFHQSRLAVAGEKRAQEKETEVRKTFSRSDFYRADDLIAGQRRQDALAFLARAVRSDSGNAAAGRRIAFLLMQQPWFVQRPAQSAPRMELRSGTSPKAFELSAGTAEKINHFLQISEDELVKSPEARVNKIQRDAVFSPDGKRIAVLSGKIHVLDTVTGDELVSHESPARPDPDQALREVLCFSPDSSHLVVVGGRTSEYGNSGKVLLLGIDESQSQEFSFDNVVCCPEFSPDGEYFLTSCEGTDQLWRIDGERLAVFVNTEKSPTKVYVGVDDRAPMQFSADGRCMKIGATLWEW